MVKIIRSEERYLAHASWLRTRYAFSFDQYYDPENTHWGTLRVANEDYIRPSSGFGPHPHSNMEVVTYVISGELTHEDNLGNTGTIRAGEVQRMTTGSGIVHAEYNNSPDTEVHLLQMWVLPNTRSLKPSWQQREFTPEQRRGRLLPMVSGASLPGTLHINQDATLFVSSLGAGQSVEHALGNARFGFLFVIDGELALNGERLSAGDQARIAGEAHLTMEATGPVDFILWDLA